MELVELRRDAHWDLDNEVHVIRDTVRLIKAKILNMPIFQTYVE